MINGLITAVIAKDSLPVCPVNALSMVKFSAFEVLFINSIPHESKSLITNKRSLLSTLTCIFAIPILIVDNNIIFTICNNNR